MKNESPWLSRLLGKLYRYEIIKTIKNGVRPAKHWLFGKDSIYRAIDEVKFLAQGANNVRVVFDVGAATGEYAIHFLKEFPKATVYCFEPLPDSFRKLAQRTAPYGSRVKVFNFGLYKKEGPATFHVAPYRDASSLIDMGRSNVVDIMVNLKRLDDVVRDEQVQQIDFIKVDVEGAEQAVLDGGELTFRDKVLTTFIEIQPQFNGYYSANHVEVFRRLHQWGFGFGGVFEDYFFSKLLPHNK